MSLIIDIPSGSGRCGFFFVSSSIFGLFSLVGVSSWWECLLLVLYEWKEKEEMAEQRQWVK